MKRIFSLILIAALLLSCTALAESWTCIKDGTENAGNYCGECGTAMAQATTWVCGGCGKEGLDTQFCPDCGTKRPATRFRNESTMECAGFASPQEAATAYVEAINAGDVQGALSTFAMETVVANMDAKAYVERLLGMNPKVYLCVPTAGPLSEGILLEQRRADITQYIYNIYVHYSLTGTDFDAIAEGQTYRFVNKEGAIDSYIETMLASPVEAAVGNITIKGAYLPGDAEISAIVPETYFDESNQNNISRNLHCYGGNEMAEVVVLLDIGGTEYAQFMQCIRYGDAWYNYHPMSNINNLLGLGSFTGGLIPTADIM